jgi:hypothetical protein
MGDALSCIHLHFSRLHHGAVQCCKFLSNSPLFVPIFCFPFPLASPLRGVLSLGIMIY